MRPGGAVVLGGSYRALEVVRSLGRRGVPVTVALTDGHAVAATSRYARRTVDWRGGPEAWAAGLDALGADGWALVPTGDEEAAFLASDHARLGGRYRVAASPWALLRRAYDKRALSLVAREAGIAQPATAFGGPGESPPAPPCGFPLVVKPAAKPEATALTAAKAWPVRDPAELAARWREAVACTDPSGLLLQECVGGREQLSYAALCRDGEVLASITARRERQWPCDFGQASTHVVSIEDPSVERDGRRVLGALGLSGLVEVEFKRDPRTGRNLLLDANPRAWGWISIGPRAGVDFAWLQWLELSGAPVPPHRGRPGVRWTRLVTDVPAVAADLRARRLTPRAWARTLRGPAARAVLAADDPVPALADAPILAGVKTGRRRAR